MGEMCSEQYGTICFPVFPYILSIMKQTIAVRFLEWMPYDKLIILISAHK